MNKRLIWNFELNSTYPLDFLSLDKLEKEELRWEARYFWPDDLIIGIQALNTSFLDFSLYKIKSRIDEYFFIPGEPYNIKKRKGEILYKPILALRDQIYGFGKKIVLNQDKVSLELPGRRQIQDFSENIKIAKIILLRKLECEPQIKFELSRLIINKKVFYSASVEGPSYNLVKKISDSFFPNERCMDYISFIASLKDKKDD